MTTGRRRLRIDAELAGLRLDQACARLLREKSRSTLAAWIRARHILLDDRSARPGERVADGQWIDVDPPPETTPRVEPEPIPLDIVYEDAQIVVLLKPAGLVVHPGAGIQSGTLVSALLHHTPAVSGVGGEGRHGLVHRLDRGTTGLMVVAKSDAAHRHLSAQFRDRAVKKTYHALVWGRPREREGTLKLPIGRDPKARVKMSTRSTTPRSALSVYRVRGEIPGFAFVEVYIATGRTHQVRVHMEALGHPLVGDMTYGGDRARSIMDAQTRKIVRAFDRPALHARALSFAHPSSGAAMSFVTPWPLDMQQLWTKLGGTVP